MAMKLLPRIHLAMFLRGQVLFLFFTCAFNVVFATDILTMVNQVWKALDPDNNGLARNEVPQLIEKASVFILFVCRKKIFAKQLFSFPLLDANKDNKFDRNELATILKTYQIPEDIFKKVIQGKDDGRAAYTRQELEVLSYKV